MEAAIDHIKDGMTIMIGGFMSNGAPKTLIEAIIGKGVKDLTVISNDCGHENEGIGRLLAEGRIKAMYASHVGLNPEVGRKMASGDLKVTLMPQGTLAERIRSAGSGLGGFLTPSGVGTIVAEGKQIINLNGKDYLLELPLKGDVALVKASIVDESGNCYYRGSTRNFNTLIAMAGDYVIVEADEIVTVGSIQPENVATPGILVDAIVKAGALS
jgi:acetate CoA/acetoacetate CoA-transferase alpha subunit